MITHWHKRVPSAAVSEYVARGWTVHRRETHAVVLIWPHDGTPDAPRSRAMAGEGGE